MSKKYIPNEKEKYMNAKQKAYFKKRLTDWRNEIIESNSKGLYLSDTDSEISSPDIVDQASSHTEKTIVEIRKLTDKNIYNYIKTNGKVFFRLRICNLLEL